MDPSPPPVNPTDPPPAPASARTPAGNGPGDLRLREILPRLWRRRASLILFPLIVGVLACAATFLLPETYLPEAIVSIELPRRREGEPLVPLDTLVQNYRHLLASANLQQPVLTALAASEGVAFTAEQFRARVSVTVPRESQFLFIGFRHTDAALATRVANTLAQTLTEQVNAFNRAEVDRFLSRYHADIAAARGRVQETSDRLVAFQREAQLDLLAERIGVAAERRSLLETERLAAELQLTQQREDPIAQRLAEAEDARLALQRTTQIESLRARREALLRERSQFETDRAETRVALAALRQSLDSLEAGLARQPQVLTLSRTIESEPALQQVAAAAGRTELADLLSLTLSSEALNPVHAEIATLAAQQRARAAELEQREQELSARLAELDGVIRGVDEEIYAGELALERLEREVTLSDAEYRALFATSPAGLGTRLRLLGAEIAALTASLEAMRTHQAELRATERALETDRDEAYKSLQTYMAQLSTATLQVLEQMPTLALFSPALEPSEPEPAHRLLALAAGLALGLAVALGRVYLLDF